MAWAPGRGSASSGSGTLCQLEAERPEEKTLGHASPRLTRASRAGAETVEVSGTLVFHALDVKKLDAAVFSTFLFASVRRCVAKRAGVNVSAAHVLSTAGSRSELPGWR
jgi:hypothetical protein